MPPPYAVIETPPGDFKDVFDEQAMKMAAIHNIFVRGLNAIVSHAPTIQEEKVQPFMHFCIVFCRLLHGHHDSEEEVYFPEIERRLGTHAMDANVDQHQAFLPQLVKFEEYLASVKAGEISYDSTALLNQVASFGEILMEHLHDEIKTLDSSRLRAVFTKEELYRINGIMDKHAVQETTFEDTMPVFMVCHDLANYGYFNPLPLPVVWAVRYWFSRKHRDAWDFGPCDLYGRLKK